MWVYVLCKQSVNRKCNDLCKELSSGFSLPDDGLEFQDYNTSLLVLTI